MAAILRDSTVVVVVVAAAAVVRTRPRAIPLAMITMRKSTHGFPFVSHIWVAYGAPLGGPSGRRSSAKIKGVFNGISCCYELRYKMQARKIDWKPLQVTNHSKISCFEILLPKQITTSSLVFGL